MNRCTVCNRSTRSVDRDGRCGDCAEEWRSIQRWRQERERKQREAEERKRNRRAS